MGEFRMPSLGSDMADGTLVEWLKRPGDMVHRGDVIAVVETQKGAIEVEVFEDGTLARLLVDEGTKVPVGAPLAVIAGRDEAAAPARHAPEPGPAPAATGPPTSAVSPPRPKAVPVTPAATPAHGRRASPAARRLAAERGIGIAGLEGSGPGGAVVARDVERAVTLRRTPAAREAPGRPDLGEMRKAIAAAMARSKREIPHYYLAQEIDLQAAASFLTQINESRAPDRRLLLSVLFLKATALALRRHPEFNGSYTDGALRQAERIHIGAAVAIRGGGLIAPAIHDADRASLDDLMAALRDLVARVRAGRLRSSELSDPTITVSSLGERGVDALFGVIYPPQVALVGFGTPAPRPRVIDGAVHACQAVTASLAADHRASDGHRGALFLAAIDRLLQKPETL